MTTIGEAYEFTTKPRGLRLPSNVSFIPMEALSETSEQIDVARIKIINNLSSGTYVENGDLLIAKITPSFENGKQGFAELKDPFGYATTEVIPMRGRDGISDKYFLAYWLRQPEVRRILAGKMEGATGRRRLSKNVLADATINLPSLPEQTEIARVLGTVQEATALQEELIAKLRELKRSMMQHLFTHGTKGEKTEQTEIGEMPESWGMSSVGKLCDIKTGKRDVNEGSENGAYPFFTCSREVYRSDTYSFDDEAILVAGNGVVGETKYCKGKFEAYQRTYVLTGFKVRPRFLYQYLSIVLKTELSRNRTGSTMPYIKKGDLESVTVPVPPEKEQLKIEETMDSIESKILAEEAKAECRKNLFKTLLHELMSGERRITSI